jgi:hypothetical protein
MMASKKMKRLKMNISNAIHRKLWFIRLGHTHFKVTTKAFKGNKTELPLFHHQLSKNVYIVIIIIKDINSFIN